MTEAEIGVVGCILINNESMYQVYNKLKPEMFSSEFCQDAFVEMLAMYDRHENINVISLSQALENHKWNPEMIASELKDCIQLAPTSVQITSYSKAVVRDWKVREVKKLFQNVSLKACDIDTSIADILTRLEELTENKSVRGQTLKQIIADIKGKYFNEDVGENRIKTGFYNLDDCLGGLEGGDVTIVAARPAVGKSALVAQMIGNMAKKGYKVAYYNLEMNNSQVYERLVSTASQIGLTRIRRAKAFLNGEKEQFEKANEELEKYDVTVYDGSSSVLDIKSDCRHQKYDVIFIDYLQLITPDRKFGNRASEVGDISKGIKSLARELQVPVIALSQLSRVSEQNATKEPTMSELRESGDIEQDASNIILMWNLDDEHKYKGLKVDKCRQGELMREALKFDGDHMKFIERSESIEQIQNRLQQNRRNGYQSNNEDDCPF